MLEIFILGSTCIAVDCEDVDFIATFAVLELDNIMRKTTAQVARINNLLFM